MWSGSILKDEAFDKVFDSLLKNSIQGAKIGDGEAPVAQGQGTLAGGTEPPKPNEIEEEKKKQELVQAATQQLKSAMPQNGWFQSVFGKDAETMVKDLRMARRERKDMRDDIDLAIKAIRVAKREEVDSTLKSLPWADEHLSSIRGLGVSDRDLLALRKHGSSREFALRRACASWEQANDVVSKLAQVEGDFDASQLEMWLGANQMRKDAKKQWRQT